MFKVSYPISFIPEHRRVNTSDTVEFYQSEHSGNRLTGSKLTLGFNNKRYHQTSKGGTVNGEHITWNKVSLEDYKGRVPEEFSQGLLVKNDITGELAWWTLLP